MVIDKSIPTGNIRNYKDILGEYSEQYVIVPCRNENPFVVGQTIEKIASANIRALRRRRSNDKKGYDYVQQVILSDQSDPELIPKNAEVLKAAKVRVEQEAKGHMPKIYHLIFNEELKKTLKDYITDESFRKLLDESELKGKGLNMYLSSLATGCRADENVFLMYLDAENQLIMPDHVLSTAIPMLEDNVLFGKQAFRRYHLEGNKKLLGGRVCAAVGVPLINMLFDKGLLKDTSKYPLAGEINIRRDIFNQIEMPQGYGAETAMLAQLILKDPTIATYNLIPAEQYLEIDVGENMDQPLAEGKLKPEIYEACASMTLEIIRALFGVAGDPITKVWTTAKDFMIDFRKYQDASIQRWMDEDKGAAITGHITSNGLKYHTKREVAKFTKDFYKGRISLDELTKEFIMPVYRLKEILNPVNFNRLVETLTSKLIEIT